MFKYANPVVWLLVGFVLVIGLAVAAPWLAANVLVPVVHFLVP